MSDERYVLQMRNVWATEPALGESVAWSLPPMSEDAARRFRNIMRREYDDRAQLVHVGVEHLVWP